MRTLLSCLHNLEPLTISTQPGSLTIMNLHTQPGNQPLTKSHTSPGNRASHSHSWITRLCTRRIIFLLLPLHPMVRYRSALAIARKSSYVYILHCHWLLWQKWIIEWRPKSGRESEAMTPIECNNCAMVKCKPVGNCCICLCLLTHINHLLHWIWSGSCPSISAVA